MLVYLTFWPFSLLFFTSMETNEWKSFSQHNMSIWSKFLSRSLLRQKNRRVMFYQLRGVPYLCQICPALRSLHFVRVLFFYVFFSFHSCPFSFFLYSFVYGFLSILHHSLIVQVMLHLQEVVWILLWGWLLVKITYFIRQLQDERAASTQFLEIVFSCKEQFCSR